MYKVKEIIEGHDGEIKTNTLGKYSSVFDACKAVYERICRITWEYYERNIVDKYEREDIVCAALGKGFAYDLIMRKIKRDDISSDVLAILDNSFAPVDGDCSYTWKLSD